MKKLISLSVVFIIIFSAFTLSACSNKKENDAEPLKLGVGIKYYSDEPISAEGAQNGKGQLTTTVAAVLLGADGKIVKCSIDTAEAIAEYTSEGKYILGESFKTKYELGDSYGMKSIGGAAKEWYEQIDALTSIAVGRSIDEVRALVTDGGKGNSDVIKAGCTIEISDFVYALEEAIKNASASDATANSSLQIKISTAQSGKDATADTNGYNELKASITVNALDKEGKTVATRSGSSEAKYTFNKKGEVNTSK